MPGEDVEAGADLLPGVIPPREREAALDDVVVGDAGADLIARRRIVFQSVQRLRQLLVEQTAIEGILGDEGLQVAAETDRVHPHPEDLGVFGLFETELRQVHLVAEASLGRHRPHEGLDVLGHRLFTRDELTDEIGCATALLVVQFDPVLGVPGEVDRHRVPEPCVPFDEETQRK